MRVRAQISGRLVTDVLVAFAGMAAAAIGAELLHAILGLTRLSLLFIAVVAITASTRGARAGLLSAVIGVVFYKMFLDLRTGDQTGVAEDLLNLLAFLIIAVITGTLAGRMHDEAAKACRRAERMTLLLRASRVLSEDESQELWVTLTSTLSEATGAKALAFDETGSPVAQAGELIEADTKEAQRLAVELLRDGSAAIKHAGCWSGKTLHGESKCAGALVWVSDGSDQEVEDTVELLAELGSASITRMRVRQEHVRIKAAEETARLRETMLSSISHDFRSPLAAIIGSASSLIEYGDQFEPAVRDDLLLNIQEEGEKLNQFVANLLNMSRVDAGVLEPVRLMVPLEDTLKAAIERLKRHKRRELPIRLDGSCSVHADPLLLHQAFYNILDNAIKYAGPDAPIEVECSTEGDRCHVVVADHGPGLPREDWKLIFQKFQGSAVTDRKNSTGLGLYITKGFIEAMGGSIRARDRRDRASGLEIWIELPRAH